MPEQGEKEETSRYSIGYRISGQVKWKYMCLGKLTPRQADLTLALHKQMLSIKKVGYEIALQRIITVEYHKED